MTKDDLLKSLADLLIASFKQTLQLQGHSLTGELAASIDAAFLRFGTTDVILFYMNDYGVPLDTGVKAERIPFSQGSGVGKSRYIEGLTRYAKLRFGVSDREAQSIAFAIAKKHKKEGMPTKDSYRYSKNGYRTNWIDNAVADASGDIDKLIEQFTGAFFEVLFSKI